MGRPEDPQVRLGFPMLVALGVVGVAVVLMTHLVTRNDREASSIVPMPPSVTGMLNPRGHVMTYGFTVLVLAPGRAPVRLTSVRLARPRGLELVGVRALGPARRHFSFTNARGFPSHSAGVAASTPATGTVITPGARGTELLIGLRQLSTRYGTAKGVYVDYEVHGRSYTQRIDSTVVTCGSRSEVRGGVCSVPVRVVE